MDVELSGMIFDAPAWDELAADALQAIELAVSDAGLDLWRANLDARIQINRGVYLGATRNVREDNANVIGDGGPDAGRTGLYGPWLEGTGSRNAPVTRFEGYHAARDAAEELRGRAADIAAPVVAEWIQEINT